MHPSWIIPDWPAPPRVRSLITTRAGGVSREHYASMNPAEHVGDALQAVVANRAILRAALPSEPHWLNQVHGVKVARVGRRKCPLTADAALTHEAGQVCAVFTADCLPVLLCARDGSAVGLAHAGWRGLADGVLERTVAAFGVPGGELMAYLGPAIGPQVFEVGAEVRAAFCRHSAEAAQAFSARGEEKFLANLYLLARQRLSALGLRNIYGGDFCTYSEPERFFSYRRDGKTGRMTSLIWLE